MDVVNLINYLHTTRRGYLQTLAALPWGEVVKDRGASFPSLRDIFLHAVGVEHRLVNYVIPGEFPGYEDWNKLLDYQKFVNMKQIREHVNLVEEQVEAYVATLTDDELNRTVEVPWRSHPPSLLRVEDILIHVTVENIHHLGELIALLWQTDHAPPFMGWRDFLSTDST